MFKRLGALVMSVMMLGSSMAAAAAADVNLEGYPSQKGYDPETVMWTDNPIENVLAEDRKFTVMLPKLIQMQILKVM